LQIIEIINIIVVSVLIVIYNKYIILILDMEKLDDTINNLLFVDWDWSDDELDFSDVENDQDERNAFNNNISIQI